MLMKKEPSKPTKVRMRWVMSNHTVKMLDRCKRDYLKLVKKNSTVRQWIEKIIAELIVSPFLGEKLFANFPECRSVHFGGNSYRIIYKINEPLSEILILGIGHRSTSYADLARTLQQGK